MRLVEQPSDSRSPIELDEKLTERASSAFGFKILFTKCVIIYKTSSHTVSSTPVVFANTGSEHATGRHTAPVCHTRCVTGSARTSGSAVRPGRADPDSGHPESRQE